MRYVYYSVLPKGCNRIYSYLSDEDIKIGSYVRIPFGKWDTVLKGEVRSINIYEEDKVPYPLDKMKKIIETIDEETYDIDDYEVYNQTTIYDYIYNHLNKEGYLDRDFSLPKSDDENRMMFADGALDGISIYHMPNVTLDDDTRAQLAKALREAANGNPSEANDIFLDVKEHHNAVDFVLGLQDYIMDHMDSLDPNELWHYAFYLMLNETDRELVKIGLSILELFREPEEKIKRAFRTLGLSDEFTLFVIFNMKHWENANEEIFNLAKHVYGWGRVHAVRLIEPSTQEIKDWLLREGYRNEVMDGYTALTCFEGSDAALRLDSKLSDEDYRHIGDLIVNMLDDEPIPGISSLEDPADILYKYFKQSEGRVLDIDDYTTIYFIGGYAHYEDLEVLEAYADRLMRSDECKQCVEEALKRGHGMEVADYLELPYKDTILKAMDDDFENGFYIAHYLMDDEKYVDPVLDVFRKHIPLDKINYLPEDKKEVYDNMNYYRQSGAILDELDRWPLKGKDILMHTMICPHPHDRHLTANVLRGWVSQTGIPLKLLDRELYDALIEASYRETEDWIAEEYDELISGKIDFGEDDMKTETVN